MDVVGGAVAGPEDHALSPVGVISLPQDFRFFRNGPVLPSSSTDRFSGSLSKINTSLKSASTDDRTTVCIKNEG